MNIELENPTMYKNIDITLDQLSTTIVALRDMIKKNQDYIVKKLLKPYNQLN